jgi:antitoxin ParD1/3/4
VAVSDGYDRGWACGDDGVSIDRKVWHNRGDRHSLLWQVSIMAMTSLNISIPTSLSDYIESRVQDGHFSTASDYFYELVREEQRRHEEAKLETMIVEALETEESIEITPQYWQTKRQALQSRFQGSNS